MAPKQVVKSDKGLKSPLLNQAIVHNGTVYVSGHVGLDVATNQIVEGSAYDRAVQALKNIDIVLQEAGSSLSNLVKVRNHFKMTIAHFLMSLIGQHLHHKHGNLCRREQSLCVLPSRPVHIPVVDRKQTWKLFQTQSPHGPVSVSKNSLSVPM